MILNVMYSCNENYIIQAGVSIISLCENNKEFEKINIHFVEDNLSDESKQQLEDLVISYRNNISFYKFHDVCKSININSEGRHPKTIYAKLFMGFLKDVDKIIYLDCDCCIDKSLYDLWKLDMGENIIAGVAMPFTKENKKTIGISEDAHYICDGVVLLDLVKWRENNMEKKSLELLNKYNGNPPMLSEGIINYICQNKILLLEPKYNLMPFMILLDRKKIIKLFQTDIYYTQEELTEAKNNASIIHYINELYTRPWNKNCDHPLKDIYLKYFQVSPWFNCKLGKEDITLKTKLVKYGLKYIPFSLFLKIYNIRKVIASRKQN